MILNHPSQQLTVFGHVPVLCLYGGCSALQVSTMLCFHGPCGMRSVIEGNTIQSTSCGKIRAGHLFRLSGQLIPRQPTAQAT